MSGPVTRTRAVRTKRGRLVKQNTVKYDNSQVRSRVLSNFQLRGNENVRFDESCNLKSHLAAGEISKASGFIDVVGPV